MATHTHSRNFNRGLGAVTADEALTIQGGGEVEQITINDAVTDQEVACAIDRSQLTSLYIKSSVIMTLETNSSSAATNTIVLKAGVPYIWSSPGDYNTCLITADVTKIFLTNASGAAGTFEMYWGYGDVTP